MSADGSYEQLRPAEGDPVRNTHRRLMRRAREAVPPEASSAGWRPSKPPARESSVDLDDVFTDEQ
jgi:polyphosphate kinase